jgi:hypothetical protein
VDYDVMTAISDKGLPELGTQLRDVDDVHLKDRRKRSNKRLAEVEKVIRKLDLLNALVAQGITDRSLMADVSLKRVQTRCAYLREKRVPGLPTLEDHLAGFRDSVSNLKRVADRYSNLRARASQALELFRTEFEREQARTDHTNNWILMLFTLFAVTYYLGMILHHTMSAEEDASGEYVLFFGVPFVVGLLAVIVVKVLEHFRGRDP